MAEMLTRGRLPIISALAFGTGIGPAMMLAYLQKRPVGDSILPIVPMSSTDALRIIPSMLPVSGQN